MTSRLPLLVLIAIGIGVGFFSGLFGVGGGVILVPLLLLLGVDQRIAAGSSSAAILPTAIVGAIGYGIAGDVDWLAAVLIAAGMIIGIQFGTWLLARLSLQALFWIMVAFLALVAVSLWVVVPDRQATIEITPLTGAGLAVLGLLTGLVSGLMGVGGGIVVVPALMFFFGASDLVAKGTSLAMMIPGVISGTWSNRRRGNIDLRIAVAVGLSAAVVSPLGVILAQLVTPFVSNAAFSLLMAFCIWQLLRRHMRTRRASRE